MWFETLTGFSENTPDQVRENLMVGREQITSKINGRTFHCGQLETPSLGDLRSRLRQLPTPNAQLRLRELVADVQELHRSPENAGSVFQVASQFNLLEMTSPDVTPEAGVGIYEYDRTQGPACAIAAGAGTIFRNYFVMVNGQQGQSAGNQIDCLHDLGAALGNQGNRLWSMRNGYALPSAEGLTEVNDRITQMTECERDALRSLLRVGIQWDTEVTIAEEAHRVTQVLCSAVPVTYSALPRSLWEPFGRLVLEATYEATLATAALNLAKCGNNKLFLTLVGGGVFGNPFEWIADAIRRALTLFKDSALDVAIVSFGNSQAGVRDLVNSR